MARKLTYTQRRAKNQHKAKYHPSNRVDVFELGHYSTEQIFDLYKSYYEKIVHAKERPLYEVATLAKSHVDRSFFLYSYRRPRDITLTEKDYWLGRYKPSFAHKLGPQD